MGQGPNLRPIRPQPASPGRHFPRRRGRASVATGSVGVLSQHRVEHLRNELPLRLRQLDDGLDLLLEARGGSALAGHPGGDLAEQQFLGGPGA